MAGFTGATSLPISRKSCENPALLDSISHI